MASDDLPGLERDLPDEPAAQPAPASAPTTYDGLTNAQLDRWFEDEYGGQAQFDTDFARLLENARDEGGSIPIGEVYDPDLRAVLENMIGRSYAGLTESVDDYILSDIVLGSGWLTENWRHLGPELKARFRRWADSRVDTTTPPGKDKLIIGTALAAVVLGGIFYLGVGNGDEAVAAAATSPPTTVNEVTTTSEDTATTTLADGADPEGDVFGSPGIQTEDSAEAAASDIMATAYFLDGTTHVFQMKVRGDGAALAAGDVRWYNPRFVMQTPQGEFVIDVDGAEGTARLIDGPFTDAPEIDAEIDWLEPGCLQVAVNIIGLTDEATAFRTELTVRLADGTDYSDDASFGE